MATVLKTISLLIFLPTLLYPQRNNIKFEHLTTQDGISDNRISCIIQDRKGFMWFGTMDGLNKYDGYKFTIYKNDPNDTLSLADNWMTALYEDHSGELWIGTRHGGLCRYDHNRDTFIHYSYEKDNPNSLCDNLIVSIFETDQHVLWIGCANGLNKYNRETDNFTRYYPEENRAGIEINVNWIGSITQDYTGQLWIGTWNEGLFKFDAEKERFFKYEPHPKYSKIFKNQFTIQLLASRWKEKNYLWFASYQNGLYKIDLENGEIKHYKHQPDNPASISDNKVWPIYQRGKESEELWIGTEEGGLNRFNIQTEEFTHYRHQPGNQCSLKDNYVMSIFKDKSGLMWLGTLQGVDKFEPKPSKFQTIQQYAGHPESLLENVVTAIHESNEGGDLSVLWIGTYDGLDRFDRTSGLFTRYKRDPENSNSLSNNFITTIIESRSGNRSVLWVGTAGGLNKIDLKTKRITRYYIQHNDPVHNQIYSICEDKNGIIWIGTQSSYLYSFDPKSKQFTRHRAHRGPIFILRIDSSGMLWLGTEMGIYKFNIATKEETRYHHIPGDVKSISNNNIWNIIEDKNGTFWIGTSGGLNKFDGSTEIFTHFVEKDGLSNNVVRAILEDRHGNLWLSTNKGISKFNPNSKEFRNFYALDGLHGNQFFRSASQKNHQGEMFFGGRNGLTYFHPDSIKDNSYIPPIILTDFQLFNKSIKPGQNSPLKKQVSEVKEITLSYDQSVFSFEFAALAYHKQEKIRYAYIMENVDPDWVLTNASRRFATYTHLDPGEYVFRVKESNNDGIWDEQGTSVKITILPPWWKTWWAYSIYAVLILGTVYGLRRYELSRQRLKHNLKLEHVEAEKFQELDRMKSRFFANISHEFRTPLTLIKGPIERWLPKIEQPEMRRDFEITHRNTHRLLRLVNQLLDISRLESGKMRLQACPENIVELTRQLTMAFESLASVNDIELRFVGPEEPITVYLEREHYEKIISNLLINALKFTPAGGEVVVDIPQNPPSKGDLSVPLFKGGSGGMLEVRVKDTGQGIPSEKLPHIFNRFYQADDTYAKDTQGSGIGLSLTKELVELHYGKIEVSSEVGKGTEFTIRFPVGKDHLKPEEIVDVSPPSKIKGDVTIPIFPEEINEEKLELSSNKETAPSHDATIVLIVEDNPDMRSYIRELLVQSYKVMEAADGQDGFEKATEIMPDIIISDVMMPVMDGFQFCEKIKTDERTSHIPVILLTAKSSGESKVEGLETGADDYLIKPFDSSELKVRVKNLIEQRRKLRERFQEQVLIQPSEITVTSSDARFLERSIAFVEAHLDDNSLDVKQFSKEIALSRSQLNRKLNALTGQSAKKFIRCLRLKRAAQLLEHHSGNISEIAYTVGFSNPAYFAECFRKLFGVSPSQYVAR